MFSPIISLGTDAIAPDPDLLLVEPTPMCFLLDFAMIADSSSLSSTSRPSFSRRAHGGCLFRRRRPIRELGTLSRGAAAFLVKFAPIDDEPRLVRKNCRRSSLSLIR
jgi:hypothetical protein